MNNNLDAFDIYRAIIKTIKESAGFTIESSYPNENELEKDVLV